MMGGCRQLCAMVLIGSSLAMAGSREDEACDGGDRWLVARGHHGHCGSYPFVITGGRDADHFDAPLSKRGRAGNPCQFNVDCLPGLACYKANNGAVEGQCAREALDEPAGQSR